ncbi:MAG: RHS repeat-associated core domain-containing protein, partial [Saprospiraceae bacterium]
YHNLPYRIVGAENDELQMLYGADGSLLQRKYLKNNAQISKRDYLRGKEYKSDILESIYHKDGRVIQKGGNTYQYEYHIKDHLGNVRVTFEDMNANGIISSNEIKSRNDYYSFGMEWNNRWELGDTILPENLKRYNGKELFSEMDLGHYAYGKRFFDPVLGRFVCTDPISDQFPSLSTYNYASNNPILNIDLHGLQGVPYQAITDIKQTLSNTAATLQRNVSNAIEYTRKEVAPVVGSVAGVVGFVADAVQFLALGATALSGGTSAPVTVPVAVGAEYVGIGALAVQASAELVEKGNLNNSKSEIIVKAVAGSAGEYASNSIKTIKNVSDETIEATNAIAQGVINTAEKATNYKFANSKSNNTTSTSVKTQYQSVSLLKLSVTDNNQRN